MSQETLSFSNVLLSQTGKRGVLKQLDGGYYEILLGAFGTTGTGGWLYNTEAAMNYVRNDREFMYMLNSGRMRSEWGHPQREPGMSDAEWFRRINMIYEPNICAHIRKIHFTPDLVKDERGRSVIAVIGEVRPSGKNAQQFKDQLDNPHEDVNFSVRSFARRDFRTMNKYITRIVNWDAVFDPGVKLASKYFTPSLESSLNIDLESPEDVSMVLDSYEFNAAALRDQIQNLGAVGESFEGASDLYQVIDQISEATSKKVYMPSTKFLGI